MEKVAEHINEMQRIHEEYGAIFDHLFRQHQKSCKQPIDLSPGDLLYYGGVEWLNISDFLGKIKKGLELHAMCFVFKSAVVFLCKERLRQKKKLIVSVEAALLFLSGAFGKLTVRLLLLLSGRVEQGQLQRGGDHPLPSADPRDGGASPGQLSQGHGLALPVGAHPPA